MKTILIAGAGKGIGLSVVKKMISDHQIIAVSRTNSEALNETGAEIYYLDVLAADALQSIQLPDALDGLLYCPGTINLKPFGRLTSRDFINDFTINVTGAVSLIQYCLPALKRSDSASVCLFSSVAAGTGMPFHSSIAASKAAVEGLTRSLAAEFAPNKIRCNAIAPSLTDTNLAAALLNTAEKKEAAAKRHPLQRIGHSEDIAELAALLLSDKGSWITGQVFHVDGGMSVLR
ncbi:MAG: SDR family oxidoreductase [Bacteroidetes bacterium]|nr:SDR family oxidoreductase [Bacteroidota bacterium]